ncbi:MAG: carbohydrate ABC transporter permease [Sphaerochaetaceae bacterium]
MKKKRITNTILFILLVFISVIFIVPIFYTIFTSFKTETEILQQGTFFIHSFTSENYLYVFQRGNKYLNYYRNTISITFWGVFITFFFSALAGYAFAKLPFKGSNGIMGFILFIVTFPLAALMIPIYIMEFKSGTLNTHIGLILPNVMNVLPFSIFIMRSAFVGIPNEMIESAEIDGSTIPQTWARIMLPMASNGLIIVLVYAFYNIWGEFTMAKTLATQDASMPISVALTLLKGESWNYGVLGAVITLSVLPPTVLFIIFQDKMVAGMAAGAVKG